jgi:hypothetical protein
MTKNGRNAASGIVLVCALAVMGGCTGANKASGTAAQSMPSQQETAPPTIKGKVVETMDAGGYSYICLEKDGKKVWAAVPTMAVKVGDELELLPGFEKGPFTSPTLNKTFDQVIFSGGPVVKSAPQPAAMPAGHPGVPAMGAKMNAVAPAANGATIDKPFYAGKVVETMFAGGYTYICLEKDGKKSWSAVPPTEVKVGDEIEILPGTEMGTFKSRTLNRTFDNIVFSPGVAPKK